MRSPPLLSKSLWLIVPLLAAGWLFWTDSTRIARINYVTGVVSGDATVSAVSSTGYAGGVRDLVIAPQNADSMHWIAQTQQMLARSEWRVRHIDYENAPVGREIHNPSPYRWWLGLVAWADHTVSGRPIGGSVERAALLADPALHFLLLTILAIFTAWRFGAWPAAMVSLGVIWLFPLANGFLPGAPDEKSLSRLCAILSVLLLQAGLPRAPRRWFFAAGVAGGFGLWVSPAEQVPVIAGLALGAIFVVRIFRRDPAGAQSSPVSATNWLVWGATGAGSCLLFYLWEYYPDHLGSWRLREIHPLYAFAWLGLGAALAAGTAWRNERVSGRFSGPWMGLAFAAVSFAILVGVMIKHHDAGFLSAEAWALRLTRSAGGPEAANLWAWLSHDGISAAAGAALLPLLLTLPAAWLLWRREVSAAARARLFLALGPVLVIAGLACWQLGRWSSADAALLGLFVAIPAAVRELSLKVTARWLWSAGLAALLLPGAIQLLPPAGAVDRIPLNDTEVSSLIARDLAHWLAKHRVGKPVVLAPPDQTVTLHYYGGLPGIGTLAGDNEEGVTAAARIFSATTAQEALVRIQRRDVTHIVVPSWDTYLNEYLRLSSVQVEYAFVSGLRNWAPIPWLRPVPYQLPAIPGYEGQSVAVFEIVPEQEEVAIISGQAEYFAEMGQLEYAAAFSQALQKFPNDLGALLARGQVAVARHDGAGLTEVLAVLTPRLAAGSDRTLSWPRRVSLAALLAQSRQMDLAREQVRRCLTDANERRLRALSTGSLYRLLALGKLFGLQFNDPALRALARDLLPADWRNQL